MCESKTSDAMPKTLFCISPYQVWQYHTDCDIRTIEHVAEGFKPEKLLMITCTGALDHCDLRENIRMATGCSDKDACDACGQNKASYIERAREIASKKDILFEHKEIVEQLFHIGNHFEIIKQHPPKSVEQLAMILAMIRPGKRYLVGNTWEVIEKEVWEKTDDYFFKKSHAIGYALVIIVQLNLLVDKV